MTRRGIATTEPKQLATVNDGRRHARDLTPGAASLHRNFCQATRDLKRDIVRVVYYLDRVLGLRIHKALGHRTIEDYAEQVAGFSPAQTRRFLQLGKRLRHFPDVARALGDGDLSFSKALLICTRSRPEHPTASRERTARRTPARSRRRRCLEHGGPDPRSRLRS